MSEKYQKSDAVGERSRGQAIRKQVTVLFCDVADYIARSQSLDPEDLSDDIRVFQTICGNISKKYSGHISNYLGDGMLVLFGHPNASEFAPEYAVRAGLEMVEAIKKNNMSYQWRNKASLKIRVGIATSLVVVGEKAGACRDQDELIFGEAPNLAARLQSAAEPNTIVTSLRTRRLVGSAFKFQYHGECALKGFAQPIPIWKIIGENTHFNRNTETKRVATQFISRHQELAFLTNCYALCMHGAAKFVHLIGVAGMGKSRLVRVFERTLDRQNLRRIKVSCSLYFSATPLHPVIEELNRWFEISTDDDDVVNHARITAILGSIGLNTDENLSLISELLSINFPHTKSDFLSPEEKHYRIIHLVTDIIHGMSQHSPVLLVVEDLHWADPTTLELLEFVIKNTQQYPIFAIMISRPEFQSHWYQSDTLIVQKLMALNHTDCQKLVASIFENSPLPNFIESKLIARSSGIPLFLEESSRHLLTQIDERKSQGLDAFSEEFTLPETLQDLLNARVESLGEAKHLAQIASVFGHSFTYSNIRKIAQNNGIEADDNMDIILQADLLQVISDVNEDVYTFQHAMLQDAAYHSLLKSTRQRYHRQIANLFITENQEITETQPEILAHHFSLADDTKNAISLWLKAGKIAISKATISEAIKHLQEGLNLLKNVDIEHKKTFELDLKLNLAVCLTLRSGYYGENVKNIYNQCYQLAQNVGTAEQQWSALYGLWRCLVFFGEFKQCLKISIKLKKLNETINDQTLLLTSSGIQAMTRMFAGKFSSSESFFIQSMKNYDKENNKNIGTRFGQDPFVTIQGMGAINRLIRQDYDYAKRDINFSVENARNIGHPYTIAETLRVAAMYEQISRNMIGLNQHASEAIAISEKYGFDGILAASRIFQAFCDVISFRDTQPIERIKNELLIYKNNYGLLFYSYFQGLLAEAYLFMDQYQNAFTESSNILFTIERYGETWSTVPTMLIRAESAAKGALAEHNEIRQWYFAAAQTAQAQGAELYAQRVALSLSEYEKSTHELLNSPGLNSADFSGEYFNSACFNTPATYVAEPSCIGYNSQSRKDFAHSPSVSQYLVDPDPPLKK